MRRLFVFVVLAALLGLSADALAASDEVVSTPGHIVSMRVEAAFYEIDAKMARDLQVKSAPKGEEVAPTDFVVSTVDGWGLKALSADLEKKSVVVNRPVLSMPSGQRATLTISSVLPFLDEHCTQQFARVDSGFTATPTLHTDGTITLKVELTVPHTPKQLKVSAERSFSPGGAMTMVTADDGSGKGLLVVFTPSEEK